MKISNTHMKDIQNMASPLFYIEESQVDLNSITISNVSGSVPIIDV